MSWIKIISINIFILFALVGILLLTPLFIYLGHKIIKSGYKIEHVSDSRANFELYSSYDWAESHFKEIGELSTNYYDYITWRRNDYTGITINIKDGLRVTSNINKIDRVNAKYWFFGGSTTWGTGVSDDFTYPSLFAKKTGYSVINFGEAGYLARQSLSYLNNYLIQNQKLDLSGNNIIFYDGVNEVLHKCRREVSSLGSSRESQIQNKMSETGAQKFGFDKTFEQLQEFLTNVFGKLLPSNVQNTSVIEQSYSCALNEAKAIEVANTLVDTWEIASNIVNSRGGTFTAILQPVAFLGNPIVDYLNLSIPKRLVLAKQYQAVYPLIIEVAKKRNINFINLTNLFDGCSDCYIDFMHVGPQGHKILVERFALLLSE